jgi:hypothetical protein
MKPVVQVYILLVGTFSVWLKQDALSLLCHCDLQCIWGRSKAMEKLKLGEVYYHLVFCVAVHGPIFPLG